MKFQIKHECRGRIRVQAVQQRMTLEQADMLEAWLLTLPQVECASVHERTRCAVIEYQGDRKDLLRILAGFSYQDHALAELVPVHSSRALNRAYEEKLVGMVAFKAVRSLFFPAPLRAVYTVIRSAPYLFRALRCLLRRQLHVELLDGISVCLSMVRRDFDTASSVMFLLRLGELLEEWTHKKSVENLARSMSLNIDRVWMKTESGEELVPLHQVQAGDQVVIRMGGMIPLDGTIAEGEVMLNQASLTGESIPVPKRPGSSVYAGTVVEEARRHKLHHEERHARVEYLVAHGIASTVDGRRVIIGSAHFVFEDEGCTVPPGEQAAFDTLPKQYSHLYLAVGGVLAAVICISDPLRAEAADAVAALHSLGVGKIVMLTGDSERTAAAIAAQVGVDEYRAEVLPEDKAHFVQAERSQGRTVVMIGDGVNDSPALSAANVGIAISDGAAIAREIADITIAANDLFELVQLRRLSMALMNRIQSNYRFVIGFNGGLIALGALGVLAPATSATLHNLSTLGISLRSMTSLLPPAKA